MICEEVLKPLAGPMGALGISSETSADLGKERRAATKTPPGEMLIAVANSKESLPLPSRVRIKTGMASCNRAHLRSSFFASVRGTCLHHPLRGIHCPRPHLRGQTLDRSRACLESLQSRHQHGDYRSAIPASGFQVTTGQTTKVQCFSLRSGFQRRFQLTVDCT